MMSIQVFTCVYCVCFSDDNKIHPRPSNDTFICVSILFCSCCGFSLVCKKLLFCRKNARGGSFLPHCQLDLLQFLNLRVFALFCGYLRLFLRKFSLELVSHQSKQFLFSVELGQPRENRSNSGKLLGSEICATNWKKCIELSISVSNDHRGKKKCYVGRSWCIKPNLLCQTGQKNCLEILEAGFRAESLPRSDKFEWFKCLMHLRFPQHEAPKTSSDPSTSLPAQKVSVDASIRQPNSNASSRMEVETFICLHLH